MFRRINLKALVILFAALLSIVVVVELADSRKGGRTFKSQLVSVEADNITAIEIFPRTTNGQLVKLFKEEERWKVESEGKKYNADPSTAKRLISQLNDMKPKSMAATKQERWEKYEVTDSLGTRVKLLNGSEYMADLVIGKFSFSQPRNMTSYVRLAGEKEVYGVDGMLGSSFNRDLNSFRDRTIIKSDKTEWTKLIFDYPADSSFVLEKKGAAWMIGDAKADSASVAQYLNKIANLSDGNFTDLKPVVAPTHQLTIEGNNSMQKVEITGYWSDGEDFILSTNQNNGAYFNSKTTAEKIFVPKLEFIQKE
ncbi:MAG: DUF4340 domain-containing protein [Mariniphaga sp.]|nr:DUF4340 domain-containing protein [Mariniphaga sp.]